MRPLVAALVGITAVAAAPRIASAEAPGASPVSPLPPQVVVEGQAGGRMPLGRFGLAADVDVARGLAVTAGVGMDVERTYGPDVTPRYAIMPRYRVAPWGGGASFSAGLGVSYGKRPPFGNGATRLEGELSAEYRFADGVRARAFGGYGVVVDPNPAATAAERRGVYGGVALGYAVFPNPEVPHADSLSLGWWYGWQSLAFDSLAVVFIAREDADYAPNDPDFIVHRHLMTHAAAGTYLVGGPMVHVAHRHYGRAAVSLALRIVVPLLGLYAGSKSMVSQDGDSFATQGAVVGLVAAAIVDDFALAWERYPSLRP